MVLAVVLEALVEVGVGVEVDATCAFAGMTILVLFFVFAGCHLRPKSASR